MHGKYGLFNLIYKDDTAGAEVSLRQVGIQKDDSSGFPPDSMTAAQPTSLAGAPAATAAPLQVGGGGRNT
jgi:hypothetical protein